MFALVDCNNFYASCERVFNPKLLSKPVLVLSNNDGCVIARSNETKALGIKMGTPLFKIKDLITKHKIEVFSSNFSLYGDMSRRVMATLSNYSPNIEIYSIDESFLEIGHLYKIDYKTYGQDIRYKTQRDTGIPVSVGIAPTKTLAKIANFYAKKYQKNKGVCIIEKNAQLEKILQHFPIQETWGIGRKSYNKLVSIGVRSAYDFIQLNDGWIRKNMTITGLKIKEELIGNSCLVLEELPPPKKGICTARSFGTLLTKYEDIETALANYVETSVEKLRKQKSTCKQLQIFLQTNKFRKKDTQYFGSTSVQLPNATNYTPELIKYALVGLKKIYKEHHNYKKVGVILSDISSDSIYTPILFDTVNRAKSNKVTKTVDRLNKKYGKGKMTYGSTLGENKWGMNQNKRSKNFTSNIKDVIMIK